MARGLAWTLLWGAGVAVAWRGGRREIAFALLLIAAQPAMTALRCDRLGAYPIADRYLGTSVLGLALLMATALPARLRTAALYGLAAAGAVATLQQIPTWKNQGNLLEHALQAERARSSYERAVRLAPPAQQGVVHRSAIDAQVGLGWCDLQAAGKPNPQAALRAFESAIQRDAQSVDAWIGLGVAHGMAGHATDAERALRRAIEIAPNHTSAHFNLAYLYEQQGQRDRARAAAQDALRCDPNNAAAQALLDRVK
jgi:tetratricopeptide (TPR) repeat protein